MLEATWIYGVCFFVGLVYMILSWVFGSLVGGAEGGVDAGSDVHVEAGDMGGHLGFSPLSPTVIATFVGGFGAGGYIAKESLSLGMPYHLFVAIGSGFVLSGVIFFFLWYMFKYVQSSSAIRQADVVGTEAEVIIPIPQDGLGEISFSAGGRKMNAPARCEERKTIPARTVVIIDKVIGNTYYVKEKGN